MACMYCAGCRSAATARTSTSAWCARTWRRRCSTAWRRPPSSSAPKCRRCSCAPRSSARASSATPCSPTTTCASAAGCACSTRCATRTSPCRSPSDSILYPCSLIIIVGSLQSTAGHRPLQLLALLYSHPAPISRPANGHSTWPEGDTTFTKRLTKHPFACPHHHHESINLPTAGAQAFITNYT
jgi:hypothetical protein